jgi:hypothetical protein
MDIIRINKNKYYDYQDICTEHPSLTKGCNTKKKFIDRKLEDGVWVYGRKVKDTDEWIESDGTGKKVDKLLVRVKWFNANLLEKSTRHPPLPDTLELEETEMFHDENNNILNIHVVGERDVSKCYFSAKDVGIVFGITNLLDTIRHKKTNYEKIIHYHYFETVPRSACDLIYLTYEGLLKVLFSTRNGKTKCFTGPFINKMNTIYFGTKEQKLVLASQLLGVSPDIIKLMCSVTSGPISCIYLFTIGLVKDLGESMEIDQKYKDTDIVCKWGRTCDLGRRTREHVNTYGKIEGSSFSLKYQAPIDEHYTVEAENAVKDMFLEKKYNYTFKTHKELVIIPSNKFKDMKNEYNTISNIYTKKVKTMVTDEKDIKTNHLLSIADKNQMISDLEKKILIMERDMALKEADYQIKIIKLENNIPVNK